MNYGVINLKRIDEDAQMICDCIGHGLYETAKEMISNYFKIIEEANVQLLSLIDKLSINSSQYFPMFGFDKINPRIKNSAQLKDNQIKIISEINSYIFIFFFSTYNIFKSNQICKNSCSKK